MHDFQARFEELIQRGHRIPVEKTHMGRFVDNASFHGWLASASNLLEIVFGGDSMLVHSFLTAAKGSVSAVSLERTVGIFGAAAEEYSLGYLKKIRREISEEFVIDACIHAEALLAEGHLQSAAVLAAAALEDCFKTRVTDLGESTDGKTLTDYINILKTKGVLSGGPAKVAATFPKFRNAAMHADWTKIDKTELLTVTAFVKNFSMVP